MEILKHELFLAFAVPALSLLAAWLGKIINRARFRPLFDAHRATLEKCKADHEAVLKKTGANEVLICECSNGGKMPSMANNWSATVLRCYTNNSPNSPADYLENWTKHAMDDGFWQMIGDLLHSEINYFPIGKKILSPVVLQSHEYYQVKGFVFVLYLIERRFLWFGTNKIIFARYGFMKKDGLQMDGAGPDDITANLAAPNIHIPISTTRQKLAEYFK